MTSHTSSHSWMYTTIGVLAGLGVGYLVALLTARLTRRRPERQQASTRDAELLQTLSTLSTEVARLRDAVMESQGAWSGRHMRTVESSSEFVSARSESVESEDEFFDITTTPNSTTPPSPSVGSDKGDKVSLDEQSKRALEKEDVASSLVDEIKGLLETSPADVGLLWRLARALTHLSMHKQAQQETESEKELLEQAADYARQALDIDHSCWEAHQWYATAVGSMSKFQGTQAKIAQGFEYKEHIDKAISLNPDYPTLHYLSGRWCYEVASLSWLEKKAAAALYATPPEATYDESLQCFMTAEELNPGRWKGNMLMVAKCHVKLGDVPTAVEWLNRAYNLPTITTDDETNQSEIEELLLQHDENFMA